MVLERAARLEPGKASILEALGRAYFNSAQTERSRETFEALLEIDPSAHYAHFALGQSLKRLGRSARPGRTCGSRSRSPRRRPLPLGVGARARPAGQARRLAPRRAGDVPLSTWGAAMQAAQIRPLPRAKIAHEAPDLHALGRPMPTFEGIRFGCASEGGAGGQSPRAEGSKPVRQGPKRLEAARRPGLDDRVAGSAGRDVDPVAVEGQPVSKRDPPERVSCSGPNAATGTRMVLPATNRTNRCGPLG